jgi:DNA-binding MarR family transcriptional regulator
MNQEMPQFLLMQQLGRTYRAMQAAFESNIGHSAWRWRILLSLYQQGDLSQKQLATRLRLDPAALTRQIKPMEQLGWVRRQRDSNDNRLTNVTLTEDGFQVVKQTLPRRAAFIENTVGGFSDARMDQLLDLLQDLERHLLATATATASAEQP